MYLKHNFLLSFQQSGRDFVFQNQTIPALWLHNKGKYLIVGAAGGGVAHAAGKIGSSMYGGQRKTRDTLHPMRCGPREDVLNLWSTFVPWPGEGGWK